MTDPETARDSGYRPLLDPHHKRENMKMIEQAIKHGWPVSDDIKQMTVNQMALVVGTDKQPRNKIRAAKVLIDADTANIKREAAAMPKDGGTSEGVAVNVAVSVNIGDVRRELLNDREYIQYASRSLEGPDSSTLRSNGQPGTLDSDEASDRTEPGANGHHPGG